MWRISQEEVFRLAVEKYSDTVYRAAVHPCSSTADAEDVVQDVFEKLLRYRGAFSGVSTQSVSLSGNIAWDENPIASKPFATAAWITFRGESFPSHHVVCVW